jgi:hypothetical protein
MSTYDSTRAVLDIYRRILQPSFQDITYTKDGRRQGEALYFYDTSTYEVLYVWRLRFASFLRHHKVLSIQIDLTRHLSVANFRTACT